MITNALFSLLLTVTVPEGFRVEVFAEGLGRPRAMLALDDGTVLVSRPAMNDVVALRDTNGDGVADEIRTAVAAVEHADALAMRGGRLYVAAQNRIVAADRLPDGSFGEAQTVVEGLPAASRRALSIGSDGKLYVAAGSDCAECIEAHPEHAAILQFDADGSSRRIFARGLGDTAALEVHPNTGELWSAGGIEINRVGDGLDYGWPYCTGRKMPAANAQRPEGLSKEKFCRSSEGAALELPARASGFAFYRGSLFPEEFHHDAFSAAGSRILRVRFAGGRPLQAEEFAAGAKDIAGLTASPDGSILFSDASNGTIYRITHGSAPGPTPGPMTSSSVQPEARPVLTQVFRVTGLRGPASVVHDVEQDVYFVSNVDGAAGTKDGRGFIARIAPDGKVTDRSFIDGLDAPKGLAIRGTELWIADVDVVRAFDRVTGAALQRIELASHGAISLEGIAVGPDDAIYVTDMDVRIRGEKERLRQGDGRIFRIGTDGSVEVAFAGEELRSPSGIAWDGNRFLIAQAYGNEVLEWNRGGGTKAVLRGPGAWDGIVVLPNGAVILSSHYDEGLHIGRPAAAKAGLRPLFACRPSPGDIAFDRKRNRLLVPSADGDWMEAWTLPPLDPPTTKTAREAVAAVARR